MSWRMLRQLSWGDGWYFRGSTQLPLTEARATNLHAPISIPKTLFSNEVFEDISKKVHIQFFLTGVCHGTIPVWPFFWRHSWRNIQSSNEPKGWKRCNIGIMDISDQKISSKSGYFFYYSFRVDLLIKHNIDSIRPICSDLITSLH